MTPSRIRARRHPGAPRPARRGAVALLAVLLALATVSAVPAGADTGGAGSVEEAPPITNTPYNRQGMWVWYVSHSEGGSLPAIIARAKRAGIGTVYVKAGDGATVWGQFSTALVAALHHHGIDACAWQFVYGDAPAAEARVGAAAVRKGADCLVIDAESDYEGKYAAADTYIRTLRGLIGPNFPLSLAGFPYVDYHPSFPYSVFLGPGGATFNQPQMYWKAIGTSVRTVFEHTYLYNRIWGHPIFPIGQTYEGASNGDLRLFRRYAASYGDGAPSWWDWQETIPAQWHALGARAAAKPLPGVHAEVEHPLLKLGSKGDMVVWAQEHLIAAGATTLPVTGIFGRATRRATLEFQEGRGLPTSGAVGTETWQALMQLVPYRAQWAASARPDGRIRPATRPRSASLPARADEIPPRPR